MTTETYAQAKERILYSMSMTTISSLCLLTLTLGVSCGNVTAVSQDLSVRGSPTDTQSNGIDVGVDGHDVFSSPERVGGDSDLAVPDSGLPSERNGFDVTGIPVDVDPDSGTQDALPLCPAQFLPGCACLSEGSLNGCRCPDNYAVTCRQ